MTKVYLLLGSNMNNPGKQLSRAIGHINKKIGRISRRSAIYQTAAWGKTAQPDFLNQVIIVQTNLDAEPLMQMILSIEEKMGRIRTEKNAPRIIDIDILFYDKEMIKTKTLHVPHPAMHLRRFVLVPLNALSSNFIHPVFRKTIHQLLLECPDRLDVKKI